MLCSDATLLQFRSGSAEFPLVLLNLDLNSATSKRFNCTTAVLAFDGLDNSSTSALCNSSISKNF